ncbi:uncharacterized protein LOC116060640 isoform X2 [Sander lucioperca]|uniref:uncharacterized protein LOC116060640 isoform X2 n=1 Tax=Sander lucioperca TaxID=283035 RepID=UPI00125D87A9|nr:uncharacterized protein LOC116060640 isoform X2 [Sander lucioperca]
MRTRGNHVFGKNKMGQTRKRSSIWMHFSNKGNDKAECNICRSNLSYKSGSTNNLHRHLKSHHPGVQVAEDVRLRRSYDNDDQDNTASVEVSLEDSDTHTPVNDADINSAINGILEAAQGSLAEQITHEEASDDRPVKCRRNKRSLVWRHFEYLDSLAAARCRICMKKLKCFKDRSTSNLHRHLSKRHPGVFSQLVAVKQHPPPPHSSQGSNANGDTSTPPETVGAPEKQRQFSVEVSLEDSDTHTPVNDADINSAINGILEAAQGSLAEQITHEEASDDRPVKCRRNKRSLVWRHFEYLDSLAAARCRICMKKLKCFKDRSTSNLHRHLSKRHPGVFSQLVAVKQHPPPPHSSQGSNANGDTSTPPETVGAPEKQRQFSVEVSLEDSDTHTPVNDADINSAINGILEAAQGSLAEQITHEEASDDRPVKCRRNKRSLVWRHFEYLDSLAAARCRICMKKLKCFKDRSTSNLHRHLSKRHPGVFSQLVAVKQHPPPPHSSQGSNANVEVSLEDSDTHTPVNDADINFAINGILEAAQGSLTEQITHEEASDDRPVKCRQKKRSLVWRHFEYLDSLAAARCRICMKKLECSEGRSTSNLHRHLSKRHPGVFSQLVADKQHPPPPHSSQGSNANVEVSLEDSDTHTTVNDADINSAINGILEAAQGSLAEQITHEEASDDRPVKCRQKKRSLVWRHYEYLHSLAAARCRICMNKLECSEGRRTSNLHRHLSKRHPGVFSQLVAVKQHPPPPHSSQGSNANGDTSTPPETVGALEKQRQFSGKLKVSRASEGEKHVLRRERELIEALRRVQKEEARALEHQRELLESLRAVNAREAAAERQQIESLRKVQLEEAKDLSRQREEVQKEKTQLQKKWEELQQEREEHVLLLSREQQAS